MPCWRKKKQPLQKEQAALTYEQQIRIEFPNAIVAPVRCRPLSGNTFGFKARSGPG